MSGKSEVDLSAMQKLSSLLIECLGSIAKLVDKGESMESVLGGIVSDLKKKVDEE